MLKFVKHLDIWKSFLFLHSGWDVGGKNINKKRCFIWVVKKFSVYLYNN